MSQEKVFVGFERLAYLAHAMAKDAREVSSSPVVSLALLTWLLSLESFERSVHEIGVCWLPPLPVGLVQVAGSLYRLEFGQYKVATPSA